MAIILLGLAHLAQAEDADLAQLFKREGVSGTLLIQSIRSGQRLVHDDARAGKLFPVASTFKVFNTLIALEEGAIENADSAIPWDGQHHAFESWNRDQTLMSAFKASCVWCYQALARRVGTTKYKDYLSQAGYGELQEPFELTEFWLDGSLRISAEGQIDFLRKVTERRLPFRNATYDTLKQIMLAGENSSSRLYAKTGWATRHSPQIGWYVGYVETTDDIWLFALNMNIRNQSDLPFRQKLVLEALTQKGILTNASLEQR
jgi:beta-lactamase class D